MYIKQVDNIIVGRPWR